MLILFYMKEKLNLSLKTNRDKKVLIVIKGAILTIAISLVFSYLRSFALVQTRSNSDTINLGISKNFIKIVIPLIVSPVLEEYIFRKWIPYIFMNIFDRSVYLSILLSNVIFSLAHFDSYFLPFFANGLLYSFYYEKTKDIKIPISIHMLYNIFVFLVTYV